jgi:hypothetical protein
MSDPIHDINAEPPPEVKPPEPKAEETKPPETKPGDPVPNGNNLIPMSKESQGLAPTNHVQLSAFIKQMIAAKAIPKHLTSFEQVISAWNYAAQLNLPPQPSLRNIAVIEGSPSLFGDLPLALVQRHPDFLFYEEYCIDEKYNKISLENKNLKEPIFAGVANLQRRGMPKPQSFSFTVDDANRAGINAPKTKGGYDTVWAKYPQDMYIRKARIRAIRALFADALTGAAIAEDNNYAPDLIDVTHTDDRAAALNSRFTATPPKVVESTCENK